MYTEQGWSAKFSPWWEDLSLGGGFKYVFYVHPFSPYLGRWSQLTSIFFRRNLGKRGFLAAREMIPIDEHIFQMCWNHPRIEANCSNIGQPHPSNKLVGESSQKKAAFLSFRIFQSWLLQILDKTCIYFVDASKWLGSKSQMMTLQTTSLCKIDAIWCNFFMFLSLQVVLAFNMFVPPFYSGRWSVIQMSHEKNPGWLGYIRDYIAQLYRDYNKPL